MRCTSYLKSNQFAVEAEASTTIKIDGVGFEVT